MLTVERLDNASQFDSLRQDWDRLAIGNRMRSAVWAQAWWDCFPHRYEPYILVVRDSKGVQGIFPLALDKSTLRGRRLITVGSGKACGDNLGILAAPRIERHVACTLADWLAEASGPDAWDSLDFDGIQPSDSTMTVFRNQLESVHQVNVIQKSSENCWAIDLTSGWNGILAEMSKRTRRTVKSDLFARYIDLGRTRLRVAESLEEAHAMLGMIAVFHQSRWQERDVDGCFATKGFGDFLASLINHWWPSGIAYVATLELDGRPVAGGIGMWSDEELAVYLIGMDIEANEHRPGLLWHVESSRLAIDAGKQSYNFLRGDEEYKSRFGAKPTVQQRWLATSPRWIPRLRGAALQKGIEVRDWFRKRPKTADSAATKPSLTDAST